MNKKGLTTKALTRMVSGLPNTLFSFRELIKPCLCTTCEKVIAQKDNPIAYSSSAQCRECHRYSNGAFDVWIGRANVKGHLVWEVRHLPMRNPDSQVITFGTFAECVEYAKSQHWFETEDE